LEVEVPDLPLVPDSLHEENALSILHELSGEDAAANANPLTHDDVRAREIIPEAFVFLVGSTKAGFKRDLAGFQVRASGRDGQSEDRAMTPPQSGHSNSSIGTSCGRTGTPGVPGTAIAIVIIVKFGKDLAADR
jgi:hypothetical protein